MREEIRKLFPLEFYINNKGEMVSEISLKTLNKLSDEIIKLEEENEELNGIFGTWNSRKLIKKFNKEYDKEDKNKNPNRDYVVIYPDAEEVYKRYYALKKENERLKEQCKKWKENHKAVCIQRDDILDNIVEDIEDRIDYKSRNEKAIKYIYHWSTQRKKFFDKIDRQLNGKPHFYGDIADLLNILNGGDE